MTSCRAHNRLKKKRSFDKLRMSGPDSDFQLYALHPVRNNIGFCQAVRALAGLHCEFPYTVAANELMGVLVSTVAHDKAGGASAGVVEINNRGGRDRCDEAHHAQPAAALVAARRFDQRTARIDWQGARQLQ